MEHEFIKRPCPNPEFSPDLEKDETYCGHCDKMVKNLHHMTEQQAREWVRTDRGCVTVATNTDGATRFKRRRSSVYTYVFALVVGLSSLNGYAELYRSVVVEAQPQLWVDSEYENILQMLAPEPEPRVLSGGVTF